MSKKHIKHDVFEKGLDPSKPHSLIGIDGRLINPTLPSEELLVIQLTEKAENTPSLPVEPVHVSLSEEPKSDLKTSKPKRVPPAKKKSTNN